MLTEAIELALNKVPISDFHGIYRHDMGYTLMDVYEGQPFAIEIDYFISENDIEMFLRELYHSFKSTRDRYFLSL